MLYILRHGRTDWNLTKRLQGRTDVPLNEEGRAMARTAAQACADVPFDVCYSSPLLRAKETAELVLAGRDVPILTDDRLMEMCFGDYEGQEMDSLPADSPMVAFFRDTARYKADCGAESIAELRARTGSFLREVALPLSESGKSVLIVGHGAMSASIICELRALPDSALWQGGLLQNCELMKLI